MFLGLSVKQEVVDDQNNGDSETNFVSVNVNQDEPGPSGLQQQKLTEMTIQQADGDPKTG